MEPEKVVDGRSNVITLCSQRHMHAIKHSARGGDTLNCQVGQQAVGVP